MQQTLSQATNHPAISNLNYNYPRERFPYDILEGDPIPHAASGARRRSVRISLAGRWEAAALGSPPAPAHRAGRLPRRPPPPAAPRPQRGRAAAARGPHPSLAARAARASGTRCAPAARHRPRPPTATSRGPRPAGPRERVPAQPAGPSRARGRMSAPRGLRLRLSPARGGEAQARRRREAYPPSRGPGKRTGQGPELPCGSDRAGESHLGPASRAGDGPAAARRGLKSPAPPAPPSVRRAHWPPPAPPALVPARLIGPFESGSRSACSPRAPDTAAPPGERAPHRAGGGLERHQPGPAPSNHRDRPRRGRRRVPSKGAGRLRGPVRLARGSGELLGQPRQAARPFGQGLKQLRAG
ncbi:proline-rich protein HaeIII subfamily 1-like [Neopelma chrysocephalum]|uniref:proline-rich protein HaeIII subfamily 1-like n=1 Tax=Neopelma chrysocephalum TaxID=114329 RepID=UPI000FCCFFB4|nr:proline-rich protein HaeIII subfamily 1-like [Neopelma chrysocephalum]